MGSSKEMTLSLCVKVLVRSFSEGLSSSERVPEPGRASEESKRHLNNDIVG
jgi:hypothetical protein